MSLDRPKLFLAVLLFFLSPLIANADGVTLSAPNAPTGDSVNDPNKQAESFAKICLDSWMKRFNDIQDKPGYQNFGKRYCACALTQPLDTDAAVDKAIQVCMLRTLLHESMDALKEQQAKGKAGDKEINQSCLNKWKLVYPQMSEQAQQSTSAFCSCSQPKLADLIKAVNAPDKDYNAQIDTIAVSCSAMVKP